MNELLRLSKELKNNFPELESVIDELLDECFYQIDFGGAELYEVEYCYDEIKKLVK